MAWAKYSLFEALNPLEGLSQGCLYLVPFSIQGPVYQKQTFLSTVRVLLKNTTIFAVAGFE